MSTPWWPEPVTPGESPGGTRAQFTVTKRILLTSNSASSLGSGHLLTTESVVFVELDTRQADGLTVSLEWDRDTGLTQVVVEDLRAESRIAFPVPRARAADAFRHPFTYTP
jgi:hypothetical protein